MKIRLFFLVMILIPLTVSGLERIISLSPSITETLFAVGAGKQVIAVTRFCTFPPEAKLKEKVGGFLDLEIEKVISLKPDMVYLLDSDINNAKRLKQLGMPVTLITQTTLLGIEKTIKKIAKMTGHEDISSRLIKEIANKKKQDVKRKEQPSVLLVAGRDVGSFKNIYIAGNKGFFNEIVQLAGCKNAFNSKVPLEYPAVSMEGILEMDPDIIIELVDDLRYSSIKEDDLIKDWQKLPYLKAVKRKKVFVLVRDYVTVPGPRIFNLIGDIKSLVGKR